MSLGWAAIGGQSVRYMSAEITIQSATHILSEGGDYNVKSKQRENQTQKYEIKVNEVCKYFPLQVTENVWRDRWIKFACEPPP